MEKYMYRILLCIVPIVTILVFGVFESNTIKAQDGYLVELDEHEKVEAAASTEVFDIWEQRNSSTLSLYITGIILILVAALTILFIGYCIKLVKMYKILLN
ncbi:MAG: hypothetical protein ACK5LL_05285 [Suipraeoptans sp.]